MGLLFGFFEVGDGVAPLVYAILVVCAFAGIFALWYKFRKKLWGFAISSVLAILIAALVPILTHELLFVLREMDFSQVNEWLLIFFYGLQGSTIGIGLKSIVNLGFKAARAELGQQN